MSNARKVATRDQVVAIVGNLDDGRLADILALQPTLEEVEEAVAWSSGESDVMGEERKPLVGVAAAVYEILTADALFDEDRA